MNSIFNRHRFHTVFFVGLFVLYLFALFFVAAVSDTKVLHTCVRVIAAAVELAGFYLLSWCLLRRWQATRRIHWWLSCLLVSGVVCMVYVVQVYSLYLSNNFISVLALQSLKYAALSTSSLEIVAVLVGVVWLAMFGVCTWYRDPILGAGNSGTSSNWRPLFVTLVVAVLLNACLFTQQRRRVMLEPDFRQTPFASLVISAGIALQGRTASGQGAMPVKGMCFAYPVAGKIAGYPFQKDSVNVHPLLYRAKNGSATRPNVIVFFTEGTSARLIGAYGGQYPGLTPNIDRLAGHSMKVENYYNHTAATDRGIIGQNSSGYAFAGGDSWSAPGDKSKLTGIRRQTLANVLNGQGYASYFFEPEHDGTPFTQLVQSLRFERTYTYDKISKLLQGHVTIQDHTDQLDDDSLFRGLTVFLKHRANDGDDKRPFFIGTYNIGTHAFIPVVSGGLKYGNGDNQILNKLHNYDAAIGKFLDYFRSSPYAKNTILVFTADHATYPDKAYREVAGKDLKPFFVDRIPLLVDDPTHRLPPVFDADGRNSLDLAPTVLHLLGVDHVANSFLGRSVFEPRSFPLGFSAVGNDFYITTPAGVYATWQVPAQLKQMAGCEQKTVESFYQVEQQNHIFMPTF